MVLAQSGTSRASTKGAQRYSSGSRSKASVSASTRPRPVRRAASSYHARACPISVWAIDEKATSSSRKGAIPVHSELRQPRISSSSANSRIRCADSGTEPSLREPAGLVMSSSLTLALDQKWLRILPAENAQQFSRLVHAPPSARPSTSSRPRGGSRDRTRRPRTDREPPRWTHAGRSRERTTRRGDRRARARTPLRTRGSEPRESRRAGTAAPHAPGGKPRKSRSLRKDGVPHPGCLLARPAPEAQSLLRLRPVARHDVLELVPVGLRILPDAVVVALAEPRVGHRQPELPDLRHVAVEELLARILVGLALDPPAVHRIVLRRDRVPVELHQRPPPTGHRLLDELALLVRPGHERENAVAPVEDVERLLPADLLHDPRVRRVRAFEERLLRDDRRGVDEPSDHGNVPPGLRRVMEDIVELRLTRDEVVEAGLAGLPQVLDHPVEIGR